MRPLSLCETTSFALLAPNNRFHRRLTTGDSGIDLLFGGPEHPGLVQGAFYLFSGDPGVGKSHFLLSLLDNIRNNNGIRCCLVNGEEDKDIICERLRKRKLQGDFRYFENTDMEAIIAEVKEKNIKFLAIDSLQSLTLGNKPHTTRILTLITKLIYKVLVREMRVTVFAICQNNKDGSMNGANAVLHEVDCHLSMRLIKEESLITVSEKEKKTKFRWYLEMGKNRLGPSNKQLIFS